MLAWRAASTAARSRGFAAGSGRPMRAAVVNSRISLVKTLPRFLSCAPFRNMMFLNCEWPDIFGYPDSRRKGSRHGPERPPWPSAIFQSARPTNPIWQDWGDSELDHRETRQTRHADEGG